jgi:hypothetical protein
VHVLSMESYGAAGWDAWRVECVKCGFLADGLRPTEAERLQEALAARTCAVISLTVTADGITSHGPRSTPLLDTAVLEPWTGIERRRYPRPASS